MSTYLALHVVCGLVAIGLAHGYLADNKYHFYTCLIGNLSYLCLGPIGLGLMVGDLLRGKR